MRKRYLIIQKIVLFILFSTSLDGYAQLKPRKIDVQVGLFGSFGAKTLDNTTEVNSVYKSAGYPSLKSSLALSEDGVEIWLNRWYFLFLNSDFKLKKNAESNFESSLSGEGQKLIIGYNLVQGKKIRVYPFVGIGEDEYIIYIDPSNPPTYSNLIVNSPQASVSTSVRNENTGAIGLGLDYKVATLYYDNITFLLGFMGGYHYGSTSAQWRINDQLALNPGSSLSGFEAKVSFKLCYKFVSTKQAGAKP